MSEQEEVSSVEHGLFFKSILAICILFTFPVIGSQLPYDSIKRDVFPYLLPDDHPAKPAIDKIFQASRVTFNLESLKSAGFKNCKPREHTKIIVTSHPDVPGIIFKLFLDTQRYHKNKPEHEYWVLRAKGARKVRKEIKTHHLEEQFKVPTKWIYELPDNQFVEKGYFPKSYILVEEDMQILPKKKNNKRWGSKVVTKPLLRDLALILKNVGLEDAKPDNFPFSSDGKIAFVDTQTYDSKKINYKKLLPFLSEENRNYWKELMRD